MSAVDRLRLEVAWSAFPNDAAPVWTDVTRYWLLNVPVTINRGRGREDEQASPGTMVVTLDNSAGTFNPENGGGPYYGAISRGRPIRVTYLDPTVNANMVDAESASFEGGTTGLWGDAYFGASAPVTLSNTTARASSGTHSMRVTWPASAGAVGAQFYFPTVIGRTYTARCRAYVQAGSPAVRFGDVFGGTPTATSSTTGAWETLTITWTAASGAVYLVLGAAAATTAGQFADIDAVMIGEGSTLGTFTTTQASVLSRFSGFIASLAFQWSLPNAAQSVATVLCVDRLNRFGGGATLRSVVEEEHAAYGPVCYFPLGEPEGATRASDMSGAGLLPALTRTQIGAGGTLQWAAGTGPGTDGLPAPIFTPASASAGLTLRGTARQSLNSVTISGTPVPTDLTLSCFINTSTVSRRILAFIDSLGSYFDLSVSASGKLVGTAAIPLEGLSASVASSASVADGATHHVALVLTQASTTATIYRDGVSAGTFSTGGVFPGVLAPWFDRVEAGGASGSLFAGTMAHVAVYASALTAGQVADLAASGLTGFTPERSDLRIARLVKWADLPAAWLSLDVGASTVLGHVDSTGKDPLAMMQEVAATEDGPLFCKSTGEVTFHSRSRRFNASVAFTAASYDVEPSLTMTYDDQRLANFITATGIDTGTVTLGDSDAIARDGYRRLDYQSLTTSASELESVAQSILSRRANPEARVDSLTFDLLTASDAVRSAVLNLDVSDRFEVSGFPSSAPISTVDVFAEGFAEVIGVNEWTVTVSASPASSKTVWVLGDPVLSKLGSTTRLGY